MTGHQPRGLMWRYQGCRLRMMGGGLRIDEANRRGPDAVAKLVEARAEGRQAHHIWNDADHNTRHTALGRQPDLICTVATRDTVIQGHSRTVAAFQAQQRRTRKACRQDMCKVEIAGVGARRTEELSASVVHPCTQQSQISTAGVTDDAKTCLSLGMLTRGSVSAQHVSMQGAGSEGSPQLCMTARVCLTTSAVKTCSPVMGHTPPLASVPATAAMILHVACPHQLTVVSRFAGNFLVVQRHWLKGTPVLSSHCAQNPTTQSGRPGFTLWVATPA